MQLASRFASRSPSLRSDYPLTDDQIHRVAPSIFADAPHESRSQRYAYIPTAAVLAGRGLSLAWSLVVVALAPVVTIVGYEAVGHRHLQDHLTKLRG